MSDEETPKTLPSAVSLAQFFDGLPGTVWITDTALKLTFVEGAILRSLGMTSDQAIGRSLPDVLLDGREDHPIIQGHITALAGHETSVRVEWGGSIYYLRVGPHRSASGTIIGCIGVHQQIGWMPDDDGTLRESDIRLRRVIDSNMIGIFFGNVDGQITDANEAFLQIAGYSREDLVADGLSWPSLTPVEFHQRQLEAIDEIRRTGRCTPIETDVIRKDGRRITVLVGGARMSAQRRDGVAFVLDITERKRLKRRLQGELACADALLEAEDVEAGITNVLRILCEQFDWVAAGVWRSASDGVGDLAARHGDFTMALASVQRIAGHAVRSVETVWSADACTLALPLTPREGRADTALLLVSRRGETPDMESVEAARAIAVRLSTSMSRARR